jgi:hypothetical protein
MKEVKMRIGVVALAVLTFGAIAGSATADDAPAVLKQKATITDWIAISGGHEHWGLSDSREGKKEFKVKRRAFQDIARYIDVDWSLFDALQKPDLVMAFQDAYPLSADSFEVTKPCTKPNLLDCIKLNKFPIGFGIQMLENADTSVTPHAYIYVPARLKEATPSPYGDKFWLPILHIPDDIQDCAYPELPAERRLCTALLEQVKKWYPNRSPEKPDGEERDYKVLRDLAEEKFGKFIEDIFVGYCVPNPDYPPEPNCGGPSPFVSTPSGPRIEVMGVVKLLFGIRSHNEIAHGNLKVPVEG